MPNLELLHFEGVNMIEYEDNSKKKKKKKIEIWKEEKFLKIILKLWGSKQEKIWGKHKKKKKKIIGSWYGG